MTVVGAVAISVISPDHNELQLAEDAVSFRAALSDRGRALAGAVIDVGFAATYGLLGLAAIRASRSRGALAGVSAGLIVAAALFDELENIVLIANIVRHDDLTDGWITAMQVPGTLKWLGAPGFLLLLGLLIARLLKRRNR